MVERNLVDDLGNILKHMFLTDPFYSMFLSSVNKEEVPENQRGIIPYAAIGLNVNALEYTLYINPEPWFKMSKDEKKSMLRHEVMHLTNFHLINADAFPNKKMDNVGCD